MTTACGSTASPAAERASRLNFPNSPRNWPRCRSVRGAYSIQGETDLEHLETSVRPWPTDGLPATPADRTRRVYDLVSGVYPLSTMLFHSRAHRRGVECAGIHDGMRVLEVATGSGEMFRRLVEVNPRRSEERRVGKECRSRWSPYH